MSECIRHPDCWQRALTLNKEPVLFAPCCTHVGWCADCCDNETCKVNYGGKTEGKTVKEIKACLLIVGSLLLLAALNSCSPSMTSQIQTVPTSPPTAFNDYGILTYTEAARANWGNKGMTNEVLALGGALSLAGLSTALLGAVGSPAVRGIAIGTNGLLGALGILKPSDRDAAYNAGAGLLLEAEGEYVVNVRAEGFCTVPTTQMSQAGTILFQKTNAAIKVVGDILVGLLPTLNDLQVLQPAQLPAVKALRTTAVPCN